MKLRLLWMTVFCLLAFCANTGITQDLQSIQMRSGESADSLTETQIRLNHAKTHCLIHQVGDKAELNGKLFRNNLTGTLRVASDFSTQMQNQMLIYSEDTTLDNSYPVKIGTESYLLVMEKKGDRIDIDGGILGVGTELRFEADKWTSFLGSQYRNGGCVIDSQGLQLVEGTEKRDETLGTQTEVIPRPEAVDSELPDTIIPKFHMPGLSPSVVGRHSFKFELSDSGNVDILILDLSGQSLRKLTCGKLESGKHIIPWDGMDDSGRLVQLGLYVYQIRLDGEVVMQDRLLLRAPRD